MKLKIAPEVAERYPDLRIGIATGRGIQNRQGDPRLEELKLATAQALRRSGYDAETLGNHPNVASWRRTYQSFGVKPNKFRPTAESLLRRVLSGKELPTINVAVDAYLVVECETFLPIGGYDLDKIAGDITLRSSPGGEGFVPLGGDKVEETEPGEIVYSDERQVLTRRWNYQDCDATKITLATTNLALFMEVAEASVDEADLSSGVERLKAILQTYCGGTVVSDVLSVRTGLVYELPSFEPRNVSFRDRY